MHNKKIDKTGKYLYGLIGGFLGAFLGFIISQIAAYMYFGNIVDGDKGFWVLGISIILFGIPGALLGYFVYNGDKDSVQDFHHCC